MRSPRSLTPPSSYPTAPQVKKDEQVARVTRLGELPSTWRAVLIGSTFLVTASSYGLLFFSAYCFEEFQLATDRIEDMCVYSGCEKTFIKPFGLLSLIALFLGLIGWQAFGYWTQRQLGAPSSATFSSVVNGDVAMAAMAGVGAVAQ